MRVAVVVCMLAGCAYKHLDAAAPGQRVTVGCLDLAIARRADTPDGAVLEYRFGNHCDHASPIALPTTARGRTLGGQERTLVAYDPQHEIVPLQIDARTSGTETIEYRSDDDYGLGQVCIDVASIVRQTPASWICVGEPTP